MSQKLDGIIIGAGPSGLACAIEAIRRGLDFAVVEKGCIVNSIYHFPENMTFFTTAELLEIGDLPMVVRTDKPTRLDGLKYYRRVVQHYGIRVDDRTRVDKVEGRDGSFRVTARNHRDEAVVYECRKLIVATGYFDHPNLLGVPGEELDKVSHYYTDPHPYYGQKVAVIGGKNSAAIAALELYRNGVDVVVIHRGEAMASGVKYWILPDINNRIANGEIPALFNSRVVAIRETEIDVETPAGPQTLENDAVLAMTGYHPDAGFLESMGIEVDPDTLIPAHDPETLQSNIAGIFLAGSIVSGRLTSRIFIETGRFHGEKIFPRLASTLEPSRV